MTGTARALVPDHLLDLDEWDALDREEVYRRAERFAGRYRYDPADVVAVLEVPSPGSRRTDRVAKLAEYAEAGIAHYGIVDPESLSLVEFVLDDGRYEQRAEHRGTAELALGVTIDLDALR